jgi:hypothetical protein
MSRHVSQTRGLGGYTMTNYNSDLADKHTAGLQFIAEVFDSFGWEHRPSNTTLFDVTFQSPKWRSPYTGKIKNNLGDSGVFPVYRDMLVSTSADRVFHVNPATRWVAWYGVQHMLDYYDDTKECMVFGPKNRPSFINVRKIA